MSLRKIMLLISGLQPIKEALISLGSQNLANINMVLDTFNNAIKFTCKGEILIYTNLEHEDLNHVML